MDITDVGFTQASVIGSMLIDEKAAAIALSQLRPEDFTTPQYRSIFQAARSTFSEGRPVDPVTVFNLLRADSGADWLNLLRQCMNITPTAANIEAHIANLRDQSRTVRAKNLARQIYEETHVWEDVQPLINHLTALQVDRPGVRIVDMKQGMMEFMERHRAGVRPEYFPWGLRMLDDRLYVGQGKFVIIGGQASHGKTALALSFAWAMAEKHRVGFFSLETDDGTLIDRLVSRVARIAMPKLKKNTLSVQDYTSVAENASWMAERNLELISAWGMSVPDIFATAQSRRYDVIYIDYIQIVQGNSKWGQTEKITEVSLDLHTKSQGTGITVVGLSQLSRSDKAIKFPTKPTMDRLRGSGQLEQDADVVILIYPEDPNELDSRRVLSIEKNKEGEVGKVYLRFDGKLQTYSLHPDQAEREPKKKGGQGQYTEIKKEDPTMPF